LPWIEPTQKRSREKVGRILDATLELAVAGGSLDVKMTDIARAANVAVGTLYQFFPTRSALIAKLFAREMAPIDTSLTEMFRDDPDFNSLAARVESLLFQHLQWVQERPGLSIIWGARNLDRDIEFADLENTRRNAAALSERLSSVMPTSVATGEVYATALLICHLWSSVIRLCALVEPDERPELIRQYTSMIVAQCGALSQHS